MTNPATKAANLVFKTIRSGTENTAAIGSPTKFILFFVYAQSTERVSATFSAHAEFGSVSVNGRAGPQPFRNRKVLLIKYTAPTDTSLRGKTDHITIETKYDGETTTHLLSILLH